VCVVGLLKRVDHVGVRTWVVHGVCDFCVNMDRACGVLGL
jgi:hypothetical protein